MKKLIRLWKEHWSRFFSLFRKETLFWSSGAAFAVGLLAGYANVIFRYALKFSHWFFWEILAAHLGAYHDGVYHPNLFLPLIPVLGAVLLVAFSKLCKDEILGYGFPRFLENVNFGGANLRKRSIAFKTIASAITIGSGGSTGYEGPVAQVGGAVGFAIGQFTKIQPGQMKIWIAAGSAGAIAAIFNAPIAGVLFAQEIILLGDFTLNTLTLTIISAGTSVVVSRNYFGHQPLFQIPIYESFNLLGLPLFALMGIAIGVLAALYIVIFHFTKERFDQWAVRTEIKPIVGAFMVGLIAFYLPAIFGEGHHSISEALFGNISLQTALALLFAKMAASSVTVGSGNSGGIFGPLLFMGAMAGSAFGTCAGNIFPHWAEARGLYALVGMGAFLAAVTHAPLTAIFLIFEITDNHEVVLAAFFCTMIATTVARALISSSIDSLELERRGFNLHGGFELNAMNKVQVKDVMRTKMISVHEKTTLGELVKKLDTTDQTCFPVVDAHHHYVGIISLSALRQVMFDTDAWKLIIVHEMISEDVPAIGINETVIDAIRKFATTGLSELAVVDRKNGNHLAGLLRHADIINAYHKEVLLTHTH